MEAVLAICCSLSWFPVVGFMLEEYRLMEIRENTVVIHVEDKWLKKKLEYNLRLLIFTFPAASNSVY